MEPAAVFLFLKNFIWAVLGFLVVFKFCKKASTVLPDRFLPWFGGVLLILLLSAELQVLEDLFPPFFQTNIIGLLLSVILWGMIGLFLWYLVARVIPRKNLAILGAIGVQLCGAIVYIYALNIFLNINIFNVFTIFPNKTYWEWLTKVLLPISIPLSVALGSYLIKRGEEKRAQENQNEQTLQKYLDKIFEILSGSRESELSEIDKELIRAKTSSVLQVLKKDVTRKSCVIRFLIDSNTISKIDMDLEGIELSDTNLEGLDLSCINLRGSTLSRATFSSSNLTKANLAGCDLRYVNFKDANLTDASLENADVFSAEFGSLPGIINRDGATIFRTNFRGVKNIDPLQIQLGKGWKEAFYDKTFHTKIP